MVGVAKSILTARTTHLAFFSREGYAPKRSAFEQRCEACGLL